MMRGSLMTVEEVFAEVECDDIFYKLSGGGLTVSGGEPLAQPDFTLALLKRAKEEGIATAIETAGHYPKEHLRKVDPFVDTYLYDVKHIDLEKHEKFTGVNNKQILSNLEWLTRQKRNVIIRVPVIPNFNDDRETLQSIVDLGNKLGVTQLNFLPYHEYGSNKYTAMGSEYSYRKISGRVSLDMDTFGKVKDSLTFGNINFNVGG
jgi:pyruvate formate lyase activating enzyme